MDLDGIGKSGGLAEMGRRRVVATLLDGIEDGLWEWSLKMGLWVNADWCLLRPLYMPR
jgi:hypothetical protein